MIWLIVPAASILGGALVFVVWRVSEWVTHRKSRALVEQRLTDAFARAEAETAVLPSPERPIDPQEVSNALNRLRALGRKPL